MFLIQAIEVVNLAADKKIWLFKQCITLMKCLCIQFEREFKKRNVPSVFCPECIFSGWRIKNPSDGPAGTSVFFSE